MKPFEVGDILFSKTDIHTVDELIIQKFRIYTIIGKTAIGDNDAVWKLSGPAGIVRLADGYMNMAFNQADQTQDKYMEYKRMKSRTARTAGIISVSVEVKNITEFKDKLESISKKVGEITALFEELNAIDLEVKTFIGNK